jgi:hypothetical protein
MHNLFYFSILESYESDVFCNEMCCTVAVINLIFGARNRSFVAVWGRRRSVYYSKLLCKMINLLFLADLKPASMSRPDW